MSKISQEQSEFINNLGDEIILNPCGSKNPIYHKDSCLRYFGIRKKSIIYNNSENDIYVKIKPFSECRISALSCCDYCAVDVITNDDFVHQEFHIKSHTLKKFPLPTKSYQLTIAVKYKTLQSRKIRFFKPVVPPVNYFERLLHDITGPHYTINYKFVKTPENKWKIYCKNKTYHCSNDMFLNSKSLKVLQDMPELNWLERSEWLD